MKQSGTTLKTLARRYRAVLIKCALINLAAFAVVSSAQALNISSGTYKDEQINDTDITISGGAFDNVMMFAQNSLKITGGNFTGMLFGASGDGLTITGGTFRGAFNSGLTSNLNLFGGNFDGLDWWEWGGAVNNLNIDSDKTV